MNRSAVIAHIAVPVLGFSTGMRSFTPLAVAAWFARDGRLPVRGTWASWLAHPAAVGVLTAGALGEYVGDKLPGTPNRTDLVPLLGRMAFGGLLGAIVATAFKRPLAGGIALGPRVQRRARTQASQRARDSPRELDGRTCRLRSLAMPRPSVWRLGL